MAAVSKLGGKPGKEAVSLIDNQHPMPASRLATERQLTWSVILLASIWSSFGPWDGLKIWDTYKGRGYLQMMNLWIRLWIRPKKLGKKSGPTTSAIDKKI